MNLDTNIQKMLFALLRKWKLIIVFALIGAIGGYAYTANFTQLTYSSTVQFLAYATDGNDEIASTAGSNESVRTSNTSKMNYAIRMIDTYIAIMNTNQFYEDLAKDLSNAHNANYHADDINGTLTIVPVEDTAMFKITVTTQSADMSYNIAKQLESTVPKMMNKKNQGLVKATVEDKATYAKSAGSLGYGKKCAIGAAASTLLLMVYIILRTLLDVRIKSTEELTEKYNIPVLGSIPNFEARGIQASAKEVKNYVVSKK